MRRKKLIIICCVALCILICVGTYMHYNATSKENIENVEFGRSGCPADVSAKAKHCNGTVGCDCPGFAPITNGKEWQKAYCKHCGHRKSCHR